jgi:putative peptidoglycan lipid II flippase
MTMTSRVAGLVRDMVIASFIGATDNSDAFLVAFRIPNFLRRLTSEGAFSQAFIPVLAEYKAAGNMAATKALIDRVSGVLGGVLLFITAISMLAAPLIATIFAPGFLSQPEKFRLTSEMIRITFPYLFLISLTGFCGAVLNSFGKFAVAAFAPVYLNLSLIFAALVAAPWFDQPVVALAWGVLLAGVVQLLSQLPSMHRIHLIPRPRWDTKDEGVRRILKLMVPALFGVSVSQVNLLVDTVLASFLPGGSVSWLYYSDRLTELPLGIFGIAIATVILPNLSAHRASAREGHFSATLDWAMRWILLIGLPSSLALIVLAEPILITLFKHGAMTARDVDMSALSLRGLSVGLIAFMLIKVWAPGFYAHMDTRTPVKIGITAMVANMVMNPLIALPLMYLWNIGHVGLALSTSLAAMLNGSLLLRGLLRAGYYRFEPGWPRFALRLLLSAAAMVGVLLWLSPDASVWLEWQWQRRVPMLLILCCAGLVAYFGSLLLLGIRMSHLRAPAEA